MDDTSKRISSPSCITHVPQEQELILVSYCYNSFSASRNIDLDQIKFDEGDARDPINFSYVRKWSITLICCAFAGITGDFDFKYRHSSI